MRTVVQQNKRSAHEVAAPKTRAASSASVGREVHQGHRNPSGVSRLAFDLSGVSIYSSPRSAEHAKLAIGPLSGSSEREADRVSERVASKAEGEFPPAVQAIPRSDKDNRQTIDCGRVWLGLAR